MSRVFPAEPVLIVDDEQNVRQAVHAALRYDGITNFVECGHGDQARDMIRERPFAVVVLDLTMPGLAGEALLQHILEERPETAVIVATGTGDLDTAVRCMRAGAFDYLSKPIDDTRLVTSTRHAIEKWETAREVNSLRDGLLAPQSEHAEAFRGIITKDTGMHAIFRYVEAIAPTHLPILVTGETGVGKELLARAIHRVSQRTGSFIPVNVAGLDDTLFADTLFGHVKGAYTSADSAREGVVAKAEDGTLFLDEIGELAPESQIKLLRLLQEREYYPLGTDRPRPTTARFVFATNLNIAKGEGRFRKDLLYRLKPHHIHIPPLRERVGDLPALVDYFLDKACRAVGKIPPTIPKELLPLLRSYHFPGNIRELEGLIFDAVVRHRSRVLSLASFRRAIGEAGTPFADERSGPGTNGTENPFASWQTLPTLKEASNLLIEEALHRSDGNQVIAARLMGLTRTTLSHRLNKKS
ncbi:MAG TPA: sigma-54 dependent transcriptional regulator [Bacteroidota bacterium]|nr:sigma-54 dependent transcriptional regulator [Bacteroidota bacterium]